MCNRDENFDFWFGNVQIRPCKLKPLESGNDSVDINSIGPDSSSEQEDMVWLAFLTSLKTALQKLAIKFDESNTMNIFDGRLVTIIILQCFNQ